MSSRPVRSPRRFALAVAAAAAVATLLAGTAAPALAAPVAAGADLYDSHGEVLNIVPPGSHGTYTLTDIAAFKANGSRPANTVDQLAMYDALGTQGPGTLTDASLTDYFKDGRIHLPDAEAVSTAKPTDGVVIKRGKDGVPHVEGTTYDNVAFGAGYAGTEDRMFLQDVLRHYGAARLAEFLGPSESNIASDRAQLRAAAYTPADAAAQVDNLPAKFGAEGAKIKAALESFVTGINAATDALCPAGTTLAPTCPAEYTALGARPTHWVPGDVIYVASLVGGIFGRGGGGEYTNALWLQQLEGVYGKDKARSIFHDLAETDDPEAPTTIQTPFPYGAAFATGGAGVAIPTLGAPLGGGTGADAGGSTLPIPPLASPLSQAGQVDAPRGVIDGPFGPMNLGFSPRGMSNALLVDAAHSASGHPTAVFGPQTGYFAPQLLTEIALEGPGIYARGVSFAGTQAVVQLGHGLDYAWSATSASGDLVDTVAERLCNVDGSAATVDSDGYLDATGTCVLMNRYVHTETALPGAAGTGAPQILNFEVLRTRHGIVQQRTLVGTVPVALVEQRSTYGGELDSVVGFARVNDPGFVTDAASFAKAFDKVDYTFNWFYADDRDISYFNSGLLPIRSTDVDFYFPRWGDAKYDWKGFLPFAAHPQATNPPQGYFVNWNNKTAPGFSANDSQWGYGPVYRSLALQTRVLSRIADGNKITKVGLTEAMVDAATADVRGQFLLPDMLAVVGDDPALKPATDLLASWAGDNAHRVDKARTGAYANQAAIALFDEWWESAATSKAARGEFAVARDVMSGGLGSTLVKKLPRSIDDHPRLGLGSSWNNVAWYGYVSKEMRAALGKPVAGPYSQRYCGDGTLAGCRSVLRASLAGAVQRALAAQSVGSVSALTYDKHIDDIRHTAIAVAGVPAIDWQNRPTFQQVVTFTSSRKTVAAGGTAPGTPLAGGTTTPTGVVTASPGGGLATTGGPAALPLVALALLGGALAVRRRRKA